MVMKLAQILLDGKKITLEHLQEALLIQKETKKKIGNILVELGYISEDDLIKALMKQQNVEFIKLDDIGNIPEDVEALVPFEFAFRNKVVPISKDDTTLYVAIARLNDTVVEDLKHITGYHNIVQKLALEQDIKNFFDKHFKQSFDEMLKNIPAKVEGKEQEKELEVVREDEAESLTAEEEAPAVKVVNEILNRAIEQKASDIHLEPYDQGMFFRIRIDGILYEQPSLPKKLRNAIVSRIKIMAKLNIAEHRLPQDGRIKVRITDKDVDLRISIIPTIFGEKAVIRILDPTSLFVDLGRLGIDSKDLERYKKIINVPYGMILVTGPTGSGKTTTLYSTLITLNKRTVNVLTVEDPVEYVLKGVNQVRVANEIGLTFARALRSFLRQDPNIIMVGEIRDTETAEIAVNAALTGHLVLSTLHTNDSVAVITRLNNMGVEPYLIATTLVVSVAQRLLRKLCMDCREPVELPVEELVNLGIDAKFIEQAGIKKQANLYKANLKGCQKCRNTGYVGRLGCYEILHVTNEIKNLITKRAPAQEIKDYATTENGMITLRNDAAKKMFAGITSVEEVLTATRQD